MLKKTEQRCAELKAEGIEVCLFCIGGKGAQYFKRRDYEIIKDIRCGQAPTNEVRNSKRKLPWPRQGNVVQYFLT